jgi:23S rRNA (guanine745-N1)-methyltransferase
MTTSPFQQLACPLDGEPLEPTANTWRCASGHSFDIASKGYTHLLPVQHKRSLDPGDHKAMVASRQRFLQTGAYQAIALAAGNIIFKHFDTKPCINLLDAGCGEGYYLSELAAMSKTQSLALLGVDISKWAILAAAKKEINATWLVASNAKLPVLSDTLDCVLCMFGFPTYTEFQRVLKADGLLIQIDSGVEHLRELRQVIYPEQKPDRPFVQKVPAGFAHLATEDVLYKTDIASPQAIADLLAMTPHYYRINDEGHAKAAALQALDVTVDVRISVFQRQG